MFPSASEGGAEQHADRRGREGWRILGVSSPPACVYSHADGLRVTVCVGGNLLTSTIKSLTACERWSLGIFHHLSADPLELCQAGWDHFEMLDWVQL